VIPKRYTSEAIVLSRRNYSEADRILTLYTKRYGKVSVIAKGVRKLKSRKRGSIEVFSLINTACARGKNLDLLTETIIIDHFLLVRKNLKKVTLGYYFVEVADKITKENEENEELFKLLSTYLNLLKKETSLKVLRRRYIYDLLVLMGYWPLGKILTNHDEYLENIIERKINSISVGRKVLCG
jgi:DNA repair protein RecO (recombination protein O)